MSPDEAKVSNGQFVFTTPLPFCDHPSCPQDKSLQHVSLQERQEVQARGNESCSALTIAGHDAECSTYFPYLKCQYPLFWIYFIHMSV